MIKEAAKILSPKAVDWVLYNLPALREQINLLEPRVSTSVVNFGKHSVRRLSSSAIEVVATKRAVVSAILDAAERGVKSLHPEHRKVYRMKYRAGYSMRRIARRLYISERTVYYRVSEIRSIIAEHLATAPQSDLREFCMFFRDW